MIDRAAGVLLWKRISSGASGSEAMQQWQNEDNAHQLEREQELDAVMRAKPQKTSDEQMAMKMLKELEDG